MNLKIFKLFPDAVLPSYETTKAACFDISAYIPSNEPFTFYAGKNKMEMEVSHDGGNGKNYILLGPDERALVRTGLIFNIPEGYSMRLHPRSGMALKYGLVLGNSEGIVDEDYILETKLIILNTSTDVIKIYHGDRIAQGELVRYEQFDIEETWEQPTQKSNRVGGFGSTGKN
jgi:dUTP pyrophosphatase